MASTSDPKTAGAKRTTRRDLPKSQRLILTSTWSHDEREFTAVTEHVRRSGVLGPLEVLMEMPHTPHRRLSVLGYLVVLGLNGSTNGHKAKLVDVVRLLNGLGPGALDRLGMRGWRRVGAYDLVHRFHKRLRARIDAAEEVLDPDTGELVTCYWTWFGSRVYLAAIPDVVMKDMVGNVDLAIDGTEMESCGRLQGEPSDIDYDGEAEPHARKSFAVQYPGVGTRPVDRTDRSTPWDQ